MVAKHFEIALAAGFWDILQTWLDGLDKHAAERPTFAKSLPYFVSFRAAVADTPAKVERTAALWKAFMVRNSRAEPGVLHEGRLIGVDLRLAAGDVPEALRMLENAIAYRSVAYNRGMSIDPSQPEDLERASLERRYIFEGLPPPLYARLRDLRLRRKLLEVRHADGLPEKHLERLADRLPAKTAVVRYHVTPRWIVAFVIRPHRSIEAVTLATNPNALLFSVEEFLTDLITGVDDWRARSRQLYARLIGPLNLGPDVERLVIIPGDYFAGVPFDLLPDADGARLSERMAVVYTSRLWSSGARPLPQVTANDSALLVGVNRGGLSYAEDEVTAIAGRFDAPQELLTPEATQANLVHHLPGAAVIHFATHASVDAIDPFRSHLQLHGGDSAELWWLARQTLAAKLLVLSACQTAQTASLYARRSIPDHYAIDDNLASIARLLNIDYVVATLWRVDDGAAAQFTAKFYEALLSTAAGDPVAAMRLAKDALQRDASSRQLLVAAGFRVFIDSLENLLISHEIGRPR